MSFRKKVGNLVLIEAPIVEDILSWEAELTNIEVYVFGESV